MREMGRTMIRLSITLRTTKTRANTTAREPMNARNARCAFRIGTVIGTETTWAPMMSLSFQPKPLADP